MHPIDVTILIYITMALVWMTFQGAVNYSFPHNDFMPRNLDKNGPVGIVAAFVWPLMFLYLFFLLVMQGIKGINALSVERRRRRAMRTINPTIPTRKD